MANLLRSDQEDSTSKPFSRFRMFQNETWSPNLAVSSVCFTLFAILIMVAGPIQQHTDYIGPDNDDVMRLVQVRDFLAGQNWFDMHQYRLGFDGSTIMHWSRLIDAPMALLIMFFSLFLSPENAEIMGVSLWPMLLIYPVVWATGRGGMYLGGRPTMYICQLLGTIYIITLHRFNPGAIDHHNAQIALIALIVAMLLDPDRKSSSFIIAGFAAALALAIGVETTPLIGIISVLIASLWGFLGSPYKRAAISFGTSFALFTSLLFFATTPISRLTVVTCDNLSIGFGSLAISGGLALACVALLLSHRTMVSRVAGLALAGAFVAGVLLKVAPECMHNPLSSLDPLLQTMWLAYVQEAQNIFSEFKLDPGTIGVPYAVGFLSIIVCTARIVRKENVVAYSVLLVLSVVSTAIACYQIRAMIFSTIIGFFPLAALIAELQMRARAEPNNVRKSVEFALMALVSVPAIWGISGILLNQAVHGELTSNTTAKADDTKICREASDFKQLSTLPTGLVAGASNIGAHILRYTPSSALSAPYHRNPNGILLELKIEMASVSDAEKMMRANNVRYYVLCNTDHETGSAIDASPNGFIANIEKGKVPDYLEKLPTPAGSNLTVYALRPPLQAS